MIIYRGGSLVLLLFLISGLNVANINWDYYAKAAQAYLDRPGLDWSGKVPFTGKDLMTAAKTAYERTGELVPLPLALSQAQFETQMGTKERNKYNVFNVGEEDNGESRFDFNSYPEGIQAYYDLIADKYLKTQTLAQLMNNFVRPDWNTRYAKDPLYEEKISTQYMIILDLLKKWGIKWH